MPPLGGGLKIAHRALALFQDTHTARHTLAFLLSLCPTLFLLIGWPVVSDSGCFLVIGHAVLIGSRVRCSRRVTGPAPRGSARGWV